MGNIHRALSPFVMRLEQMWMFLFVAQGSRCKGISQRRFDSVQTGILVTDAEACMIVEVKPVALKLIGAPCDSIDGNRCHT